MRVPATSKKAEKVLNRAQRSILMIFCPFFGNQIKYQIEWHANIYEMNCFNIQSHSKCQLTIDNS